MYSPTPTQTTHRYLFNNIDLSNLNNTVDELYIGSVDPKAEIKFNPDLKVSILKLGHNLDIKCIVNLPIIKTLLLFSSAFFKNAKDIKNIKDPGKSNFHNVQISGEYLNSKEREKIKTMLINRKN